MRLALAILVLVLVIASPAYAADTNDNVVMSIPCQTFLASRGTPMFEVLKDQIVSRLLETPIASRFGSACNMADYVRAECLSHRTDDLRKALDRLERAGAAGNLPTIPECHA